MPIYKNKGDSGNPDSYRGITLVSSVGKVFTSILNSRPTKYADLVDKIPNAQAGFRVGYSTTDNIFCLHVLIDIYIYICCLCPVLRFKDEYDEFVKIININCRNVL